MIAPAVLCHYCDRPAVVYCDFIADARPVLRNETVHTCSRALCPDHRKKVGHVCDRSRRTKNNQSDTIDHCKEHGT
jgi:hypothetical protein